jgi:hypothetical protein
MPVLLAIFAHGIFFGILATTGYHGLMLYVLIAGADTVKATFTSGFYWWSPTGKPVPPTQARLILATLVVAWLALGVWRFR